MLTKRARVEEALQAVEAEPGEFAFFRASDPDLPAQVASTMIGAASIGGMGAATGMAVDLMLKVFAPLKNVRRDLPHHLVVSANRAGVRVYALGRRGELGHLLATFDRGEFHAGVNRYPGIIDLTLESATQGRMTLRGRWGVLHHSCMRTARGCVEASSGRPWPT